MGCLTRTSGAVVDRKGSLKVGRSLRVGRSLKVGAIAL